jgi:hypothetical protein
MARLYGCLLRASLALMSGQNSGSRLPSAEAAKLEKVRYAISPPLTLFGG